jgi:hypothetical protein
MLLPTFTRKTTKTMPKDLARGRVVREYRAGKRRETFLAFAESAHRAVYVAAHALAFLLLAAAFIGFVWLAHLAANAY